MNSKSYFLSISATVIILNILIGLSAIFLVERIIPAINQILDDNAYSVNAVVEMMDTLSVSTEVNDNEEIFWNSFDNAKGNITIQNEGVLISEIRIAAKVYWKDPTQSKDKLVGYLTKLAQMNLKDMKQKKNKAERLGVTGSWALGFLILISLSIQLIFRSKFFGGLIVPLEQIFAVLKDYNEGNSLRRFVEQRTYLNDIRKIGIIINTILDQKLLNQNDKKKVSEKN